MFQKYLSGLVGTPLFETKAPYSLHVMSKTRHLSLTLVDIISDDTFEYQNVTSARVGGFDWSLLFNWNYNLEVGGRKVEAGQPVPTPTMPGGLFSVNRAFFLSLGGYDPGKECVEWRSTNLCL